MNSKCVIQVAEIVSDYGKTMPAAGKLIDESLKNLKIGLQGEPGWSRQQMTVGASIALRETAQRFTREGELPEAFVRPGDVPIKAAKGKINQREAQQAGIMNQWGLANGYAAIAGLQRRWTRKTGEATGEAINVFAKQLDFHDLTLRLSGIPLSTTKAGVLKDKFHKTYVTFSDVVQTFMGFSRPEVVSKFFLRNVDATQNVQSQNVAEAVRRIIEHGELLGKIDLVDDLPVLKAQVVDALRNPSGMGKPAGGPELAAYNKAVAWSNSQVGKKLTDELADTLLDERVITQLIKKNEELRVTTGVIAKGEGIQMANSLMKMITDLPHRNDREYAYGDVLFNNRFKKIFKDDAIVKMSDDELPLVFGENFLAGFFDEIDPATLVKIAASKKRSKAMQDDTAVGKKGKTRKQHNVNRVYGEEAAETAPRAAQKAADDMEDPAVVVQEPSLEAAQLARQYQLEFEVGPLLGGVVRAWNWVNDKATMGGKMKVSLVGAENAGIINAADMTGEISKLFRAAGSDTVVVNTVFKALQNGTKLEDMTAAQRAIAEPMSQFIDEIFGFGPRNNLSMNGIFADEFADSLKKMGLGKVADNLAAVDGYADNALGEWWKTVQLEEGQNALTMMSKVYSAMQLSRIKPNLAASLRHHFGHVAEGLTYDQAVKLGYKPLEDSTPLAKFINIGEKPVLFHPDTIRKLSAVNAHLEYERGFGDYQKYWNKLDPTIGVLKSSLTIWRPGHHMVSAIGNLLFNSLYGVTPGDYAVAMRMMAQRGDLTDIDEDLLTQALREGVPEGYVLKSTDGTTLPLLLNGKIQDVPLEIVTRGGDARANVFISPRNTKDLPNDMDPENFSIEGWTRTTPGVKQTVAADNGLAKIAAIRDNLFRGALFARELRRGGYASIDDAVLAAAQKVHEVHPTVGTLSAGEKKYARRIFYFYTWQKQALFKIMELAANQPAIVTMPSKLQYALATSAGLDPASFGDGWNPEGLYASYFTNSVFAPQQVDPDLGAVGIRPASPQLDVIDAFFSKVTVRPGLGFWEGMGELMANTVGGVVIGNATPLFKIPAELATGTKTSGQQITNMGEYLLDQTGLGGISRMTGFTPWGEQRSDFKEGEWGEKDRARQTLNYWTGIKSTYYQSPESLERARQENIDYWQRIYKSGEYSEDK